MFADEKSLINRELTSGSTDYAVRPANFQTSITADKADGGSTLHSGIRSSRAPVKMGSPSGTGLCNEKAEEEVIL